MCMHSCIGLCYVYVHATLRDDEKSCMYTYANLFVIIKIILWFILDLIRCNVLSLHIEDSSMFIGVGLKRGDGV